MNQSIVKLSLYKNQDQQLKQAIKVDINQQTIQQLLQICSKELCNETKRIFFSDGTEVKHISQIKQSCSIYASEGEDFKSQAVLQQKNSISSYQSSKKNSIGTMGNSLELANFVEINVAFIGSNKVGKSSIIQKYINNKIYNDYIPTIEDNYVKDIYNERYQIKMNILDTSGNSEFREIYLKWINKQNAIIFVFDVNEEQSFKDLKDYLQNYEQNYKSKKYNYNPLFFFIGNKIDLDSRQVQENDSKKLAQQYDGQYIETSIKETFSIKQLFQTIVNSYLENYNNNLFNSVKTNTSDFNLNQNEKPKSIFSYINYYFKF